MSKFLKQRAVLESIVVDNNGEAVLDTYGDPSYASPINVICRRERVLRDVLTVSGSMVKSSIVYYLDEAHEIHMGDKLDGKMVVEYEEYTNEKGECEGYKVVV